MGFALDQVARRRADKINANITRWENTQMRRNPVPDDDLPHFDSEEDCYVPVGTHSLYHLSCSFFLSYHIVGFIINFPFITIDQMYELSVAPLEGNYGATIQGNFTLAFSLNGEMLTNGEIYIKLCAKECGMINIKVRCFFILVDGVYLHEYVTLFLNSLALSPPSRLLVPPHPLPFPIDFRCRVLTVIKQL